jgi:glycosyltransferase involved in cell wall biosynthesis
VSDQPTRVLVVRGHQTTPWELRQWEALPERFEVAYLRTSHDGFGEDEVRLTARHARSLRDRLPRGRVGDLLTWIVGDRYLELDALLAGADIVHAEELVYWFSADVVRARAGRDFRVVQTVWETIPMLESWRTRPARTRRRAVLEGTDLFLAATDRARAALLLEGVEPERIEVSPPGIDVERFRAAGAGSSPSEHVVVSPGRLIWAKGHQDVLRAVAALRRGIVAGAAPRVLIVGSGPEGARLRAHADELGIGDLVEIVAVGYDDMPATLARASCMVLASLPSATASLHPLGVPRVFWEEQFGYVLAEAMATGLPIVAADSGAIAEVVGDGATLFAPGDWLGLARALAAGPLSRAPGARVEPDAARLQAWSLPAAGARLAAAYDRVLAAG